MLSLPSIIDEIIVCDGGSTDDTKAVASKLGARLITSEASRGRQLKAGADICNADWVLFLHADTRLCYRAELAIIKFIDEGDSRTIGYLNFKLDDNSTAAKTLEKKIARRCKVFALPYGDQGFLIKRSFYEELGGFSDIPLMEDIDLIWRIVKTVGKGAIIALDADAITSAEKFHRDGYFKRSARNLFCLFLFWVKVPPRLIVKLY